MPPRPAQLAPPGRRRSISDPLAAALLPPPNETPAERERRLQAEDDAKKRSEHIDRMIRENERRQRKKKVVKVLLLGQSESGKSTTLKQFQLLHTPAAFHAERVAWRFVIYLNLVRSIRRVLEAIAPESDADGFEDDMDYDPSGNAPIIDISGRPSSSAGGIPGWDAYRRRLAPLAELEARLIRQLSDPEDNADHEATHLHYPAPPPYTNASASASRPAAHAQPPRGRGAPSVVIPGGSHSSPASPAGAGELSVPTGSNWMRAFTLGKLQSPKSAHSGELYGWWEDPQDPVHVILHCAPAMVELWRDPKVRQRLYERRLRLEESSGFYLNDLERITAKMYFPTDEDVLKARLKTTGVVEHSFTLTNRSEWRGVDWKIYDVGGARNQRHAWAPYFDDVNAIIFLVPISAFDQVLAEDPRVNRLDDSLQLWQSVISNKLLANVNIILFLNKCDLLKAKLDSGVRLNRYMTSYRDRPNDYSSVSNYFRTKFGAIHQTYTPNKDRDLFIHLTSVTDTLSTHTIISNVRDIILTRNLKSSSLM
ncbi:heterotrimeric G-protein alpha subunit [Gelatoporia subvermispora B]|uniref:Heterotrimeric G-protein alpha subunit n=1 Tax=Ceriporiopsis subvermispora (strain B) TaxID=914234 RepID=M2QX57_CERS8|nr:heterotrimeric G-protein alpha subunit [Gelatoporia subvermispora B]